MQHAMLCCALRMRVNRLVKMAANLAANSSQRTRKHSHRVNSVMSKLSALGCPYLQEMDENVIRTVVLTSGDARFRVLCWLADRFEKNLDMPNTISMDIGTLTNRLANIGVCSKDNVALVEGRTSLLQQLLFLESLLDIVEAAMTTESLSQLECSCRFADDISHSEDLDTNIFPCSLNLLPPDISHLTETRVVSLDQLNKEADQLHTLVEDKHKELKEVTQQLQCEEVNSTIMQSCIKSLSVSLSTLTQLVKNFCQSYETDFQPWVGHRQPPTLGPLGSLTKKTATHWDHICKMLLSLQQLETSIERLKTMASNFNSASMYPTCHKSHETIQQCIDMMADLTLPDTK